MVRIYQWIEYQAKNMECVGPHHHSDIMDHIHFLHLVLVDHMGLVCHQGGLCLDPMVT